MAIREAISEEFASEELPAINRLFRVIGPGSTEIFAMIKLSINRQFQLALRRLRQFSTKLDIPKTELDIDGTIDKTFNNGGCLRMVMEKPRKNSVKLFAIDGFRRNDDSLY
ncbi:hypothetical protein [Kineothrix sp. MB12-C1]|uniref:hypothetical protein n=1 Tax=Kineothrix sp. MB12-C1 TaxID=3070215 RepID=UPI0027D2D1CC|nr:hypothetical protein [Kineothrix sp. MB12-C1]WMC92719.1 hypothetical protein RBB56_00030 [Kineothrix sp. MB12-C1]